VLGPLLFTIYTSPIVSIIAAFRNVHHAQYADDTQLYIALTTDKALGVISDCFQSVHRWLDANGLCLNPDKTEAIVIGTTLVSSRLDYCNLILYGTSTSNLNKLQRVQNALARTVMMTKKCDHITLVLARLHWLPVTARIHFKIALLTFKTLTTHQPSYIYDLLHPHCSSRPLRSSSHNLLEIPRMRTGFAQRSFTYSAPHI